MTSCEGNALSVPLAFEYEAVLIRHADELGLSRDEAIGLVDYLCYVAHRQEIHFLWRPTLSDPGDEFILELAVAAACDAIVTHSFAQKILGGHRPPLQLGVRDCWGAL